MNSLPAKLILPLPSKHVQPNSHGHWRVKHRATTAARRLSRLQTVSLIASIGPALPSSYSLAFFWPNLINRDDDNAIASFKAYRDGIADGFGMDDKDLRLREVPTFDLDRRNPRLEVTLHP